MLPPHILENNQYFSTDVIFITPTHHFYPLSNISLFLLPPLSTPTTFSLLYTHYLNIYFSISIPQNLLSSILKNTVIEYT